MIPSWGTYLSDLSLSFFSILKKCPERRGTLALCLPRIEYAWCFAVFGFARSLGAKSDFEDPLEKLRPYLGHKVTFTRGGKQISGILQEVPESPKEEVIKITVRKAPSVANRKPGKSLQLTECLKSDLWSSIKIVSDSKVDQTCGFHPKAVSAPKVSDKLLRLATSFLGESAEDWLVGPGGARFAAYGLRRRMMLECDAELETQDQNDRFCLSEIVKPSGKGFVQSEGRVRLLTASSLCSNEKSPAPFSCCVVEPLSLAEQVLYATKSSNRILLLGRNAAAYAESASAIVEAYRHRMPGELVCSLPTRYPSIFHQSFFHS